MDSGCSQYLLPLKDFHPDGNTLDVLLLSHCDTISLGKPRDSLLKIHPAMNSS